MTLKTLTKHNLDGLGGPTPVLLIKDHVQHLTNHQLESHQLVSQIYDIVIIFVEFVLINALERLKFFKT